MYVANGDLLSGSGAKVFAAGSEVPEDALNSDMGKRMGWKDLVSEARTKTARATGPGTDKPPVVAEGSAVPTATK